MAFAQERAEKYFVADPEPWQKAEKGQRHPAHNPRSLPVCVLAGHSLSAAVDIISGRGWHHARAEKP